MAPKEALDQLPTYEAFVQPKDNKPYEHVGIVHAADLDMAFLFAKEQFSRRFTCTGLFVVKTEHIMVSELTDNKHSVYDLLPETAAAGTEAEAAYEIFHLIKRGKQHKHMGPVQATSYEHAMQQAKAVYADGKPVLNIWVVRTEHIRFTDQEEQDLWITLGEKMYRDAISYKAQDKIKAFKAESK